MKELTTEQKAKAYDKALERAKEWHNNPNASSIGKSYLLAVFQQLAESEDELLKLNLLRKIKSWIKLNVLEVKMELLFLFII